MLVWSQWVDVSPTAQGRPLWLGVLRGMASREASHHAAALFPSLPTSTLIPSRLPTVPAKPVEMARPTCRNRALPELGKGERGHGEGAGRDVCYPFGS